MANKKEAISMMKSRVKVTHATFMDDEWVTIQNGMYITEDGCSHTEDEFWDARVNPQYEVGWGRWVQSKNHFCN